MAEVLYCDRQLGVLAVLREEGFYRGTELLVGFDQERLDHVLG